MKTCPKDPSIKCSSSCSSCHRFRKGHEVVIVDFHSYNYLYVRRRASDKISEISACLI